MTYDDSQAWKDINEHFPNMTIYYIILLKEGPTWSPEETPEIDTLQEAQGLISTDPMVKSGRLIFELHTWRVDKNILP